MACVNPLLRTVVFASVVSIMLLSPTGASEWSDEEHETLKKLGEIATEYAKQSNHVSPLTKAIANAADRLKKSIALETVTDKSMISDKDLERLHTEKIAMDKVMPPVLPSMTDKDSYRKIVGDIDTPSTYQSGVDELKKLDEAGKQRQKVIEKLEKNRSELDIVAQRYQDDADTGVQISNGLNELVAEHPELDAFFVITGKGYLSLTALGYETEFLPALMERASAAKDAVKRYNKAIEAAKEDLETFSDLKTFMRRIYSLDPAAVETHILNPQSVDLNPDAAAKVLEEAKQSNAKVQAAAAALQAEAARINAHNAKISRIQGFIALARASMEAGQAVNEVPTSNSSAKITTTVTNTYTYNMQTKIIVIQPPRPAGQPTQVMP